MNLIRSWSQENNLFLNEKKSGIVPFQQRRGKDLSQFTLFEERQVTDKKTGRIKIVKVPNLKNTKGSLYLISISIWGSG